MDELKSIVTYHTGEYGHIVIKLSEVMKAHNITRNRLATITGSKYPIVNRYYKGDQVERLDLDFLAKVCYVLDCRVEELLEYQKPEEADKAPE